MSKSLIKDDTGNEPIIKPFVMIVTLVLMASLLVTGLSRLNAASDVSQGLLPNMSTPFGFSNYTFCGVFDMLDPRSITLDGEEGFEVSDDDVLDYVPYPTDEDPFIFVDDEGDKKYVHVIRANRDYDSESADRWEMYYDFIAIRRHVDNNKIMDPLGAFDNWDDAAIPFSALVDHWDNSTYNSVVNFQLSGNEDSLLVNSTALTVEEFEEDLYDNDFRLFYGWSLFRLNEIDFQSAAAIVLYAELPGVNPYVNWIFHGFIWATVIFIVFEMFTRIWPF